MEEENCEVTTEYVDPSLLIKPEQLDDLCRLCANTDNQLMPIFSGEGLEHKIRNKIQQHLPIIKVTDNDRLPLNICYHCASSLIAWHNLYEGCKIADSRLRKLFGEEEEFQLDDETYQTYQIKDDDELEEDGENIDYNDESQQQFLENIMQLSPTTGTLRPAEIEYEDTIIDNSVQEVITPDLLESDADIVINNEESRILDTEGIEVRTLTEEDNYRMMEIMIKEELEEDGISEEDDYDQTEVEVNVIVEDEKSDTSDNVDDIDSSKTMSAFNKPSNSNINNDHDDNDDDDDNCYEFIMDAISTSTTSTTVTDTNATSNSCDVCFRSFRSSYNLTKHKQSHAANANSIEPQQSRFVCRLCGQFFSHEYSIFSHLKLTHDINGDFNAHTFCQTRDKKQRHHYYCDICGKPFLSRFNLNQHYITHTGQRDVKCDQCDYRCYTKTQLDVHKVKHNKRYCCERCSKMFVYPFQLETHLQSVHYNLRPFKCDICNKMFKTKYNLGSHKAMHKNIRNFHCVYCTHKCRTSYDLKIHERTHTREKPYECSYCRRGFNQKGDRAKHEKLHEKYRNQQRQQEEIFKYQQQQGKKTKMSSALDVYLTDADTGSTIMMNNIVQARDISALSSLPL